MNKRIHLKGWLWCTYVLAIAFGAEAFHIKESRVVPGSWTGRAGGLPAFCLAVGESRTAQRNKQNKKAQAG